MPGPIGRSQSSSPVVDLGGLLSRGLLRQATAAELGARSAGQAPSRVSIWGRSIAQAVLQ